MGTRNAGAADVEDLYTAERDRFVAELRALDRDRWGAASLCTGWTVRDLVAHLLMPYELGVPGLLRRLVAARFSFDRLADRWARDDRRSGSELVDALGATTAAGFAVPGAGALAPLSHLLIHAQDVRQPLGLPAPAGGEAAVRVLDDLTRGRHPVGDRILHDLRFEATDADWAFGATGPAVTGPAVVLLSALNGRTGSAAVLGGAGSTELAARLSG
jgi:uncharacterized protein (TIGR03083 family)